MMYLGGKAKIAKELTRFLKSHRKPGQLFVEPFLGGCHILPLMENPRIGSEINSDVLELWKQVQSGWVPQIEITEDLYYSLKRDRASSPSALRGFVGTACSFGGKWWGGYARDPKSDRNYAENAKGYLTWVRTRLEGANLVCCGYSELDIPDGSMVYCDPPYEGTTGYGFPFDSQLFWSWADELSLRCDVYVSEYRAPDGWVPVWKKIRNLEITNTQNDLRTEYLFSTRYRKPLSGRLF